MVKNTNPIDVYIQAFPQETRMVLKKIQTLVRGIVPEGAEVMRYGMPTFQLNGKNVIHFAGWKSHIGLYPTPSGIAAFKKELSPYKGAKGSVQFPLSQPIPYKLLEKIVRYRVQESRKKIK